MKSKLHLKPWVKELLIDLFWGTYFGLGMYVALKYGLGF